MSEKRKDDKPQKGFGGGGPMGSLGKPADKSINFKVTLVRLLRYLKPQRIKFIAVFIFTILSTIFSVIAPKIMGKAITKIAEGSGAKIMAMKMHKPIPPMDFTYIGQILLILLGLYLISAAFSYLQQYIMAGVSQKTVYNMRREVDEKLSLLPLKFFDARTHGEILSRVTNDIDNISTSLQQSLTQLITSIVTIIFVVVMMLSISPLLTVVVILTLPLYLVVTMNVAKHSQKHFASQQKSLGELNGHVEEMYTGHKIVKAFGREDESVETFNSINDKLYTAGYNAQFISGIIMPLIKFVGNIGYVIICVIGGILATRGTMTIGDILAFIQYSGQFTGPIAQASNMANIIQSTVASAERIFELLDENEELPDASDAKVIIFPKGEVKFENVDFSYKKGESLIKNMNIEVKQGQTIAIVGPTGAGKTTIVNLLMRFYEIDGGKITIDGVNIRDIKRGELRNMFGMVLQDTWLFNGTIMENIAYGKEGATEKEVIEAASAAHAHHFIKTLPDGYNTILNEEASNISQGQKQLLTIARAILANPTIMILDEATSSVDSRTEVYIQRAMTALMQNKTSFVIAHRLSTIRDAELILVMDKGSIIEVGSHNKLLAKNGFYAELYNSQFTGGSMSKILT